MTRIIAEQTGFPIAAGDWLQADLPGVSKFLRESAERAAAGASLGVTQQHIVLLRSLRRFGAAKRQLRLAILRAMYEGLPLEIGELRLDVRFRLETVVNASALRFALGQDEAFDLMQRLPRRVAAQLLIVDDLDFE